MSDQNDHTYLKRTNSTPNKPAFELIDQIETNSPLSCIEIIFRMLSLTENLSLFI